MMTRIKQWLQKLFSWWGWWEDPEPARTPVEHASSGISVDPMVRSSLDNDLPRQGVAPQMGSQGEPRRSTMENWRIPDPLTHPYSTAPEENWTPQNPFSAPAPVPPASARPKSEPEVEQHLEFLRYLVSRGIVNEGFPDDQAPAQYKKNRG